jgi:hypothetical protein
MKNNSINVKWLIPALGIGLIGGGFLGATTHSKLERLHRSGEAEYAALGRLTFDASLCQVLRMLHEGNVPPAAQRLDVLLCDDILALNSELAPLEGADRGFVSNTFRRLSLVRPTCATLLAETGQQPTDDQMRAETILAQAAKQALPEKGSVAVLP